MARDIASGQDREAVQQAIATVLEKDWNATTGDELKAEVKQRKKAITVAINENGPVNRIQYFDIFNAMIRDRFYKVVDRVATRADINFLKATGFGTQQWSDDSLNFMDIHTVCSNVCLYCVDEESKILMADFSEKRLKDIEIGDIIIGIYQDKITKKRKMMETRVLNKISVEREAYKIILEDNTELICSTDHRWLTDRGWKFTVGKKGGNRYDEMVRPHLTKTNKIVKIYDSSLKFDETNEYQLGYLSGMIHGKQRIQDSSKITSIEKMNETRRMIDIETDCGSFIANGCVSHNCYISGIYNRYGRTQLKDIIESLEKDGLDIVSGCGGISGNDRRSHRPLFKEDPAKVAKTWGKRGSRKVWMSPTAHDTFPENVDASIAAWKRLLEAGHYLIIVSKPLLPCIDKITSELAIHSRNVRMRFTITSNKQDVLDKWELFAPAFEERVACLKLAKERGFTVSVSMEPFLSDPVETVRVIDDHVNGEIWIGMMNGFPSEKVLGKQFSPALKAEIERAKQMYAFGNIERVVATLRGNPKVQWKESVVKAFIANRGLG